MRRMTIALYYIYGRPVYLPNFLTFPRLVFMAMLIFYFWKRTISKLRPGSSRGSGESPEALSEGAVAVIAGID